MSISHSLANALSGLTAASRSAELVSNNVANATNENYGRREIELSSHTVGGRGAGVKVVAINRMVDQALLSDRRLADASLGESSVRSTFYARLEQLAGTPDRDDSLGARVAQFEASLLEAASRPDSMPRLQTVADAAVALAGSIKGVSDGIQDLRMDAERQIQEQVHTLNTTIGHVTDLNKRIIAARQSNQDTSALEDQRQQAIDSASAIVPMRVMQRDNGSVALYTTRGTMLIDGHAAKIGFDRTTIVTARMSHEPGVLNGLTIDGREIQEFGKGSPLGGGSLSALFELRDSIAVDAQTRIDAIAGDLVGRFADPALDDTLAPGDTGLFGDQNPPATDPDVGLASRLAVNPVVLPQQGGDLWRIRDGINAAAQGDVGDTVRIQNMIDVLADLRTPARGDFMANQTLSGLASDFVSGIGVSRQTTEASSAFAKAQQDTLRQMQLADGVDTDQEMQKLMLIEQAYAANARVMTVVDEMMRTLMGI